MNKLLTTRNTFITIIGIVFCIMLANLIKLQIVEGVTYLEDSLQSYVDITTENGPRGLILDKEGNILADNYVAYNLYLKIPSQERVDYLQQILDKEQIGLTVNEYSGQGASKLIENINEDQLVTLSSYLDQDYFYFEKTYRRSYTFPEITSHVLGYTGIVSEEELKSGLKNTDVVGKSGVEKYYDQELRGQEIKNLNSGGSTISLSSYSGLNIYLNLDVDWQSTLYTLLEKYNQINSAQGGAAIILEADTGKVAAMVSYPGYDINDFAQGIDQMNFQTYLNDVNEPLNNKVISQAYTPGSIFKILSTYGLLSSNVINDQSSFYSNGCISIGGYPFCEYGKIPQGQLNLNSAITVSSNLFFCNFALEADEQIQDVFNTIKNLKLDQPTEVDLPGEISSYFNPPSTIYSGDICNLIIGQGTTLLTPIRVAVTLATLENGGNILKPKTVNRLVDNNLNETLVETEIISKIPIDDTYRDLIISGMYSVAHSSKSAVSKFFVNDDHNLKIKTGSAETVSTENGVSTNEVHSWVAGFFDYNGKTYSFAIFQRFGGGGYYVAPLLKDFLSDI